MTSRATRLLAIAVLAAMLALGASSLARAGEAGTGGGVVAVTTVSGPITPVTADHLTDAIAEADAAGAQALVVSLDTPGGLITAMRAIVQQFLSAPIPVVVHVAPPGADAGSAGTFITMAAHVAAMAPATTIGAATPVDLEGGEVGDKIINDAAAYAEAIATERGRDVEFAVAAVREGASIIANEALERGVIDLIARDLPELLGALDGREVALADGSVVTLSTAGAPLLELEPSFARRVLQTLADPNVAFILLSLATVAIIYEIANPGVGAGGVTGAVALILGLYALSALPTSMAGLALMAVAAVLFTIEVFVPGIGVAALGGTIALVLGGLFLFPEPTGVGVDLSVLLPTVLAGAAATVLIGIAAARTRGIESRAASDGLIDRTATVYGAAEGHPRVRLDGSVWRVRSAAGDLSLADDVAVRVVGRDNLDLLVVPDDAEPAP